MATSTFDEAQTQTVKYRRETKMQTLKKEPQMSDEDACRIIMRWIRKRIMIKRMIIYRTLNGILYS